MSLLVFHRCGGKSLGFPPNTLLTARWAQEHAAKAIEYDIVLCKDGDTYQIVVIEPKLLKEAGLDINNLDWKDVAAINTGNEKFGNSEPVFLEEMFQVADPSRVAHQIHLKGNNPKTIDTILQKVKGVNNFILTTFDVSVIREIKQRDLHVRVGWIIKPLQEKGNEGAEDLTAAVTSVNSFSPYSKGELNGIVKEARESQVDVIILCAPRIKNQSIVETIKSAGFEVGAWGVGSNLDLARKLIEYGVGRFTIDNPEQL